MTLVSLGLGIRKDVWPKGELQGIHILSPSVNILEYPTHKGEQGMNSMKRPKAKKVERWKEDNGGQECHREGMTIWPHPHESQDVTNTEE